MFRSVDADTKSKMSHPIRGKCGHLAFPVCSKTQTDVEIFLPFKFLSIPFNGFRGEVKNVSANQRPGRPSCFSDRPEKHKIGRGHQDLASCQVLLKPSAQVSLQGKN